MTPPRRVIQPGETRYILDLNEGEAVDLVSGFVCNTVKGRLLALLDDTRNMQRMQESRPMEPTKDRGPKTRRKKVLRADPDAGAPRDSVPQGNEGLSNG